MNSAISFLPQASKPAEPLQGSGFKSPTKSEASHHSFSNALERAVRQPQERGGKNLKTTRSEQNPAHESRDASDVTEGGDRFSTRRADNDHDEKQSLAGACAVAAQVALPSEPVIPEQEASQDAEGDTLVTDSSRLAGSFVSESAENADAAAQLTSNKVEDKTSPAATIALENLLKPVGETIESKIPESAQKIGSPSLTTEKNVPTATSVVENGNQILPKAEEQLASSKSTTGSTQDADEADVALAGKSVSADAAGEAVQNQADSATPGEARRATRAVRRASSDALESSRGIAAAKMATEMKTTTKREEIAGLTEQILPGTPSAKPSAVSNLPSGVRRDMLEKISSGDAIGAAERMSPAPAHADVSEAGDKMDLRATSPIVRVGELISREVRMFKRSADDLVEVVLTPDAKTQISLRLQWRDGRVEVQARCDLGDYQTLNTQWSQLQTSLASHGVRLSHLTERTPTGFTEFFSNPNFGQQQSGQQSPSKNQGSVMPITAPAAQPTKSVQPKSVARTNRLLESWA